METLEKEDDQASSAVLSAEQLNSIVPPDVAVLHSNTTVTAIKPTQYMIDGHRLSVVATIYPSNNEWKLCVGGVEVKMESMVLTESLPEHRRIILKYFT